MKSSSDWQIGDVAVSTFQGQRRVARIASDRVTHDEFILKNQLHVPFGSPFRDVTFLDTGFMACVLEDSLSPVVLFDKDKTLDLAPTASEELAAPLIRKRTE